jgi:hypothetical protein
MASHATEPARRSRAIERAAVGFAAGCCVLGLGALPTAQAAKSTTVTSTSANAVEVAAAAPSQHAQRLAQAEGAVVAPSLATPPIASAEQPAVHARRGQARDPTAGTPARAGGAAPPATGPAPRSSGRAPAASGTRLSRQAAAQAQTTSAQGSQTALAGEASTGMAEALARKQKKGSGGEKPKKERNKKEKRNKEKGGKETVGEGGEESATVPAPRPGDSRPASSQLPSPNAHEAASTAPPAPLITAPRMPVAPGVSSIAPSIGAVGTQAAHAAHRPRQVHKRATRGVPTRAAPAAAGVAFAHASLPRANASTRPTARRKRAAAAQPAIVKTFTRIVGVVPTPVRILIAALIALALAFAARSRLSSVRARRLTRQRGQLLEDVGLLQAALLPVPPGRLGPVGTSVAYRPADGPGAGGDFYDVFGLDDGRLAVIVGDVSGHGREALPHTALVRFTVRAYLEAGLSPRKALQTAGTVLDRQLAGSFATVVCAVYHPRARTLTYASAGHPPPVVLGDGADSGRGASVQGGPVATELTTACSAPPLGAGLRTGTRETILSVPGPARLCFHTDGVTEARVGEDLFGRERLTVALAELGAGASATALLHSVAERTDTRPDDMAACVLRVEAGGGAPSIAHELVELDRAAIESGRARRFLRESGMSAGAADAALDAALGELDVRDCVLLELSLGDGPPVAMIEHDNVVHTAALSAVGGR